LIYVISASSLARFSFLDFFIAKPPGFGFTVPGISLLGSYRFKDVAAIIAALGWLL